MHTFLRIISAWALAGWFGAMLFFSAGVAPVAFRVLPSRQMAGTMVNGAMATLMPLGMVAGGVLLVALALRAWRAKRPRLAWGKAGLAAGMLLLTLYSGFAVTPPMAEIRARVGAIDALPLDNPDRSRFDALHQLSVSLMALTMLGALVLMGMEQVAEG